MKFYKDHLNPKTGVLERVEARRNSKGFYVLHSLSLPSAERKKRANHVLVDSDLNMQSLVESGLYGARCVRPGMKGSKPNEFVGLKVEE